MGYYKVDSTDRKSVFRYSSYVEAMVQFILHSLSTFFSKPTPPVFQRH